jgi:oligopeptide/dipeptide ABC transporter ATP-binding protein
MWTPSGTVTSDASALLSVQGLTVRYGGDRQSLAALSEVSFDLAAGEIVGIVGESGSGKSTLALSLLGLLPAKASREGSIQFQNQDLLRGDESSWRAIRGARISMIFQEPGLALSPVMRVGDQIAEVIRAHRPGNGKSRKRECEAALSEVRFSDVDRICKAYPHQLSGGQLHRVAIAQAVVCRPEVIIADEATRSLDITLQSEIMDVLREVNRKSGSSLIFITHNPALLSGFADRVIVMYAGRIVEQGPVTQVFRRPLHPYTKGLLQLAPRYPGQEAISDGGRLPSIPGSLGDADRLTGGCVFEPRCSARTAICQSEFPVEITLEQDRRVSCFHHGN